MATAAAAAAAANPFVGRAVNNSSDFANECPEAGTHAARLVSLIDLGTHTEEYQGTAKDVRKVLLVWELVNEPISGQNGVNHLVSREYTLSFHKKGALRLLVESVRGKAYDENEEVNLAGMIGQPCLVTIEVAKSSQGREYAKVKGAVRPPKGTNVAQAKRTPVVWFIHDEAELVQLPAWLPFLYGEKVADKIARSPEWKALRKKAAKVAEEGEESHEEEEAGDEEQQQPQQDDEIPF